MNSNHLEHTNQVLSDDDLSAVSGGYSWNQFVGDVKGVGDSFVQGLKDGYQQIKDIIK
ncbi:hypothetical protein [Bradyrhizobium sp. JYMT SZCCT0428]|uniref:hypothetical protein n=1 Tax=Bradyrhizobium sp. JYMT SZCCT0428 TaxID=2807673 RepID=UPI001BAA0C4C|nr:hypothetical protein [Bradyrhizobium sp. JYMT SZCCT0428]MBR1153508.1 hypothetical protein [Bradyrhizobium sp. JYMT SZCCT0428]